MISMISDELNKLQINCKELRWKYVRDIYESAIGFIQHSLSVTYRNEINSV